MRNKFILGVVILTILVGLSGFWFYQKNIYSKDALKLEILGPEEAELAQEVEYTVKYKNNGNIRLDEPRLIFEFPSYSIVDGGSLRKEIVIQDIYPGEERTLQLKARLMGKEGDLKTAKAWLSYRPKNLKAGYESTTSQTTRIKNVPLTLEFDLPSKIESGEEISFRLNYFSNTSYPLSDLGLKVEYPSDFEFKSAKPVPLDKTEWEIGLLNKTEGGRIEIAGTLKGQVDEQKLFKAQLGIWQDGEFILLKETVRGVEIISPSLYISQQINGNPQYIASAGDTLHYEIFFKNIGDEDLANLFLVAKLEGKALDFQTLKAPLGEFESGDNSVIFDWRRVPQLQFLDSQDEGKVEFWINLKKEWQSSGSQDFNPVITNSLYLSQARQEFVNKINSKIEIIQKGYYQDEVFGNSGPLPPKVGGTTTYTVTWQVKNYYNDIKNMTVRATLGKGVNLTGKIFPEDAKLTFDSGSREVVWRLENLEAGKGILSQGPNATFQIDFTPSLSQKGQTPTLIGKAKITGEDQWTNQILEAESSAVESDIIQ